MLPSPFVCFYRTTNYHSNTLAAPQKRFFLISDDYIILWLPTYRLGRVFFSFFLLFVKKQQVRAMQVKCITNTLFYSYTNSDMSCNNTRTTPGWPTPAWWQNNKHRHNPWWIPTRRTPVRWTPHQHDDRTTNAGTTHDKYQCDECHTQMTNTIPTPHPHDKHQHNPRPIPTQWTPDPHDEHQTPMTNATPAQRTPAKPKTNASMMNTTPARQTQPQWMLPRRMPPWQTLHGRHHDGCHHNATTTDATTNTSTTKL